LRLGVLRVFLLFCVGFCTGHFVMVPVNLTYLNCLQLSYIEHLFNLQFILEYVDNIICLLYFPGVCLHILIGILVILHLNHRQIIELRQEKA